MHDYLTKIILNTETIKSLRDIINMLKHDIDLIENLDGMEEKQLSLIRERIFDMIGIVANVEEDIQARINCLVADYFNGLYAKISYIEAFLKIIREKHCGWKKLSH